MRRACLVALIAISPMGAAAQQPVTLPVGSPLVRPDRIVRGIERFEMVALMNGQERVMGTYATKVEQVDRGLLVTQETRVAQGTIIDSAWVDPVTFVPTRQVSYGPAGTSELRFEGTRVRGSRTPPAGAVVAIDDQLPAAAFSASLVQLMVRALPLTENFSLSIPMFRDPGGAGQATLRVVAREPAPGTSRTAWKVELSLGAQAATIWIDEATGRELRTESQLPGGAAFIMRAVDAGKSG